MTPINLQYTTIKTPLPDFIYQGLKEYSHNANLYHPQPQELIEKIASKCQLPSEMICLTAGIDEALIMFSLTFGKHTYGFTPTYTIHSKVDRLGTGKFTAIHSIQGTKFTIPTNKIPEATLTLLANPNNPSGFTPKDKVLELIKNNSHAIVAIDEAYSQFANLSVIDQVKNFPHLVVLRSFSKDYGMAGNRIGWITASPEIIAQVKPKAQWSNVSYLSVSSAITALNHEDLFEKTRNEINSRQDQFIKFLITKKFQVFPSHISAVLLKFDTKQKASQFVNHLSQHQITVSRGNGNSNIGLDDSFVRIAIGTPGQMSIARKVISKFSTS